LQWQIEECEMKKSMMVGLSALSLWTAPALAEGDAAKGEKVFNLCKACHTADAEANKVGPHLKGLIGRKVASVADYKYSDDMIAFGAANAVWDEALFLKYIENPKASVPKTKMSFAGVKKEQQRADLLAYLKTKM
jgi:cytochrome c